MADLIEMLERNGKPPERVYLRRHIINASEECTRLMEMYSFAIDFDGHESMVACDNIALVITRKNNPLLWLNSPISDLMTAKGKTASTKIGIGEYSEAEITQKLKERELSILDYHPEIQYAQLIRTQFFARMKKLEMAVNQLYGSKIALIGDADIETYRREIDSDTEIQRPLRFSGSTNYGPGKTFSA